MSVKPLDQLTPADLWREVWEEDVVWSDTAERQRALLKHLLEGALEEEMVLLLEAARYRRVESRQGYRSAYERAWCDAPPHCYMPALDEAERLLKALGVEPPQLATGE